MYHLSNSQWWKVTCKKFWGTCTLIICILSIHPLFIYAYTIQGCTDLHFEVLYTYFPLHYRGGNIVLFNPLHYLTTIITSYFLEKVDYQHDYRKAILWVHCVSRCQQFVDGPIQIRNKDLCYFGLYCAQMVHIPKWICGTANILTEGQWF